jgi:hypothetical protein
VPAIVSSEGKQLYLENIVKREIKLIISLDESIVTDLYLIYILIRLVAWPFMSKSGAGDAGRRSGGAGRLDL